MATISITTANDRTSNYSPSSGDNFVLSDLASLIVDNSTVSVDIEFNSRFQEITLENTSTTQPNIVNIDTGGLNGQNGAIVLDGLLISIGTADGTASQTIQFPADANGDYPSFVGYCYIDSVIYTQITSFTGIRNDFRGRHFTYDNATGVMTFGDGTNGDMPTGDVQVGNIYVELGGSSVNMRDGFIRGNGHCVFVDGNFSSDPNISVQSSWGIINNSSQFEPYQFFKHKYSAMNYLGVGSGENVRMLLAEDTVGDTITFQTESSSSTEVVQNYNVPMWGSHELRYVAQRSSDFSRTRLNNDGGSGNLKIMQGRGAVFTPYGGADGNWVIEYSDGYKTTDLSPFRIHHGRYDEAKQNILYRLIGSTSWTGERSGMTLFDAEAGEYVIGSDSEQMVIPSDVSVDEIVNTAGSAKLTLNNLLFEGQASSGSRNLNLNSPQGTLVANISTPNQIGGGNQAEPNASFRFVSFIGIDPAFSSGMNHSIVIKDAARTQGQIWFMPHAIAPSGEILFGSADDLLYDNDKLYITNIGTKVATQSDVISGCGILTALTIKGSSTGNFDFEYKLWEVGDAEPASYQSLTLVNVQASQAGYTTATKWYFKYTVEKVSGAANAGYIQGIYFDCPVDPLFKWEPELADITIALNGGLLAGDYIRVEDDLGVTRSYTQAASSNQNIVFAGSEAGSGWRYAVDRKGFTPDVGDLTLVVGATIPVSVSLNPYRFRDGTVMYSLSTNPAVSVSFDLVTPEARITVNDVNAHPQDIFNAAENALITEDGMAWHAQQGSVVEWDDIIQGGRQLYLGAGWRLFGIGLNAGVNAIVASTDDQVFAAGSSQMRTGDGYKEYTQDDRDRDELIKARVDSIPLNPLLDDDARLDYLDLPISKAGSVTVGGSIVKQADSFVITSGVVSSGTYQDTHTQDGIYHVITDDAGEIDFYYDFDIGDSLATGFSMFAEMQGNNDDATIYAYNWVDYHWDVVGQISGENHFELHQFSAALFSGSVSDSGIVRIRIAGSGLSSSTVSIDQVLAGYTTIAVPPDNAGIASILEDTNELQQNQGDWLTADTGSLATGAQAVTLIDIAQADERVRPDRYQKLQKDTKAVLVDKIVTQDGGDIDLVEP